MVRAEGNLGRKSSKCVQGGEANASWKSRARFVEGAYTRRFDVLLRRTWRTCAWYTSVVKVTSTEFRKNLFQIVERALQGEFVEVTHKGRLVRLVPGDKPSKMSRLIQRDTIHGTPEDLDQGQRQLDIEMRTSWEEKWAPKR